MGEVRSLGKEIEYKVTIQTRDFKSSESFYIDGNEEFTMNGKTFKFKDVSRINIQDADDNGGWSRIESIKEKFGKGK